MAVEDHLYIGHVRPFRSPRGLRIRQFLRRNLLLALSTLLFATLFVLLMYQVDRVYYVNSKKDVIRQLLNERRFLADDADQALLDQSRTYAEMYLPVREYSESENRTRLQRLETMRRTAQEVLENNPAVFRIRFTNYQTGEDFFEVEDLSRLQTQNTFRNNLFLREFTDGRTSFQARDRVPVSIVSTQWTSPVGSPEIDSLTRKWRMRAALLASVLVALYGLLTWGVILPVRRVMIALDKGEAIGAPIIPNPSTLLERYYNNLGRDATLSLFSTGLRNFITERKLVDPHPLLEFAPRLACALFPLRDVHCWAFHREENSSGWEREAVYSRGGIDSAPSDFAAMLEERINRNPPVPGHEWRGAVHEFAGEDDRPRPWFVDVLQETDRTLYVLVAHLPDRMGGNQAWWTDLARRLSRELQYALQTISEQRKLIISEKSKANISLSRNIGHDLTNIIATSKLELMTVKALLEMPQDRVYASPAKQEIFRESLGSLLDNTRFLQETVNLYRSFTYLSHPKFEMVEIEKLTRDVRELFELTLSKSIRIELDIADDLPLIEVEPRLIRLALFNLLSNAAEAIKREVSAERSAGQIWIRATRTREGDGVELSVEDDGGGIRDPDGRPLEPHEIDMIFNLGYSTKEEGTGEGLGLNWVYQIVREFHGGEIVARNRPEGGARFTILLRSRIVDSA